MNTSGLHACDKLIMAVVQGDDCSAAISELNSAGFMVTILSSTGGFLKKKSTTIMIGVTDEKLDQALDVLRLHAGQRKQTVYVNTSTVHGVQAAMMPLSAVEKEIGGVTVFIMNLQRFEKY